MPVSVSVTHATGHTSDDRDEPNQAGPPVKAADAPKLLLLNSCVRLRDSAVDAALDMAESLRHKWQQCETSQRTK